MTKKRIAEKLTIRSKIGLTNVYWVQNSSYLQHVNWTLAKEYKEQSKLSTL